MREAWYIVEVYCFLSIMKGVSHFRTLFSQPTDSALGIGSTIAVAFLAFLTFRGSRVSSRILSAYIAFGVATSLYAEAARFSGVDVYVAYRGIVTLYFLVGAIKLWRIKELPTRFTDPPAAA